MSEKKTVMAGLSGVPQECHAKLEKIEAAAPSQYKGKISDIINGVVGAGVPWITIIIWLAANMPKVLDLFKNGFSVQAIIDLILSFLNPKPEEEDVEPEGAVG